jgi:hypothetical protein
MFRQIGTNYRGCRRFRRLMQQGIHMAGNGWSLRLRCAG